MFKVALGQMEVVPGRPDLNAAAMQSMVEQAKQQKADMIVFPELAIPGYLLGDTWEQHSYLRDCEFFGQKIVEASKGICIIFGNVGVDWNKTSNDGRVRKYNACFIAQDGQLLGGDNFPYPFRIKTLQPNYREFDDNRHFFSLPQLADELGVNVRQLLQPVVVKIDRETLRLGCILCEDGWSEDYTIKPIEEMHRNHGIDLFLNISSSPFTLGKNAKRNRVFSRQVKDTATPLVYVNCVGIQNNGKTIYTFDGSSTVYNSHGCVTTFCPPFAEELKLVEMNIPEKEDTSGVDVPDDRDTDSIFHALIYGLDRFLKSIGIKKAVIGISGGIDSAVSACLYTYILGPENVLLVNMPSIYNSETTRGLAAKLSQNLGCLYTVMPIQEAVDYTKKQISSTPIENLASGHSFYLDVSSFVLENIQARDRSARILAGIAASFGGGFTCNANKSELTVGYSTLYGDQAGIIAALGDLWKHQVYNLAEYLNEHVYKREIIPHEIINLVPSAELSFDQSVDQGKGDPIQYPYHDFLFHAFMESWDRAVPEDILSWYIDSTLEEKIGCAPGLIKKLFSNHEDFINDLERWWKLYTGMGVAKRIQSPPVLAVSRRAYGFDHREAQNSPYFTAKYLKLKAQLLGKN